jgi:hypothetical protein
MRIGNLRFEISKGTNSRRNDRFLDICIHRAGPVLSYDAAR